MLCNGTFRVISFQFCAVELSGLLRIWTKGGGILLGFFAIERENGKLVDY